MKGKNKGKGKGGDANTTQDEKCRASILYIDDDGEWQLADPPEVAQKRPSPIPLVLPRPKRHLHQEPEPDAVMTPADDSVNWPINALQPFVVD